MKAVIVALVALLLLGSVHTSVLANPSNHAPSATSTAAPVLISALHYYGFDGNADEAVELTNVSGAPVALDANWTLRDASNHVWSFPAHTLSAGGRMWVANSDNAFTQQFGFSPTLTHSGALAFANHGGSVSLERIAPETLDEVNMAGGWPAGSGSPSYRSMERIDAGAPPLTSNWADATPATPIAFDAGGQPITGTPGVANSVAIAMSPSTYTVVVNEIAWGGTKSFSGREWIELYNTLNASVVLTGWRIIVGSSIVALGGEIGPNGYYLVANNAGTFSSGATIGKVASFSLNNGGGTVRLIDTHAQVIDTLVYGDGAPQPGWVGPPLQPYTVTQTIPDDGQVLMRRLDPASALPVTDIDTAQDWLNDRANMLEARKPIYPGWRIPQFITPASGVGSLLMTAAPDASFDVVSQTLASATTSIDLESFTFENARIGELLAARAASGVIVRALLDGAPVGGLSDQTRWICQRITQADTTGRSGCWFIRSDATNKIHARYAFLHAKFALIDNTRVLIGSENFGLRGLPDDDKSDGTSGQRGVIAVTDAPAIVARARAIFDADIDSAQRDVTRWCAACMPWGAPPPTYTVDYVSGGVSYTVRFGPMSTSAPVSLTLFSSPESNLSSRGLLELLNAASAGDEVLVEQLDEPPFWGASTSNAVADPNPRLEALVGAAGRGAAVRVLLDQHYDDPTTLRSNAATVQYLNALASTNGWNLRALRGNPTGLGIHNKMFLVRVGGRAFAHVGSWNGTETSAKRNREFSLLVESNEAHDYLRRVFWADWQLSQPVHLPIVTRDHRPPNHALISEVMINPSGADETGREWIEVYNPTSVPLSLTGHKIGDAVMKGSTGEGMFTFPNGMTLAPGKALVVAQNAVAYFAEWGTKPDFELSNYDPSVPELIPHSTWATGELALANSGDEVVLLDNDDRIIDSGVWLSGVAAGTLPFTGTVSPGHSLQRWPPSVDSDDCALDFRDQAVPSPGKVP